MESEQSGSATVSTEAVTTVNETLVGGGENQIEDPYVLEEEDLGEIMVEVVGSDVFVDGISNSANKDGDFGSEDMGDLDSHHGVGDSEEVDTQRIPGTGAESIDEDGHKLPETAVEVSQSSHIPENDASNVPEATVVSGNEDGNKLAESRDGQDHVVSEKVEVKFTETVTVHVTSSSSCEVSKPGMESVVVSSSEMTESISMQTEEDAERATVVVGAERSIEDQKVDNDHAEAPVEGELGVAGVIVDNMEIEDEAIENSGAIADPMSPVNVNNPIEASIEGEIGKPEVVSGGAIEGEGADNNSASANRTSPEHVGNSAEAFVAGETVTSERLPSGDSAVSHDVIPPESASASQQRSNSTEAFLVGDTSSAQILHLGDNAASHDVIPLKDTNEPEHPSNSAEAFVVGEIASAKILPASGDNTVIHDLTPMEDTTAPEQPSNPAEAFAVQEIATAEILHSGDNAASHDVIPEKNATAPEHPSNTVEAPVVGEMGSAEMLHSGDNIANPDVIPLDQIESEVSVNPNVEGLDSAQVDGAGGVDTAVNHIQIDPSPSLEETTAPAEVSVNPNGEHPISVQVDESGGVVEEALVDTAANHSQIDPRPSLPFNSAVSASGDLDLVGADGEIKDENQGLLEECGGVNRDEDVMMDCTSHDQSFVSERDEAMDVDLVDVLDFNDEEYEILSDDRGMETVTVLQKDEFSSEPSQLVNIGNSTELEKEEVHQGGSDNNQADRSSLGDKELVQAESAFYIDQPDVAKPIAEAANDQNIEASLVEASVANERGQNRLGSDSVVTEESIQCQGTLSIQEIGSAENYVTDNNLVVNAEEHGLLESEEIEEENSSESYEDYVDEETELYEEYHQGEEVEDPASETDKRKISAKDRVKSSSILRMSQPGYLSSLENEGEFAESDLVWGKVKSHPWWPGQIFDPKHASDKAVKHQKKDSYLVAYFGDKSFAWNDATFLKPFRSHFSQIEKQSTSEMFQNAVNSALGEVSRRVELGLVCSCVPKDAYHEIATQVVDNAGIQAKSSHRNGVDRSCGATSFEPDQLLQYVRDLAPRASSGADRLDAVIAKSQLSAFYRFKGQRLPAGFPSAGTLLENDAETEQLSDEVLASYKSKSLSKDSTQSRAKDSSLMEVKDNMEYSSDGEDESVAKENFISYGRKRKALDSLGDISDKRANVTTSKISASTIQTPKPSFRIGECIRRVASQLTGCTSTVKGPSDGVGSNGSPMLEQSGKEKILVSAESLSVSEMLSQLQLLAQDPNKHFDSKGKVATFFSGFRNSIAVGKRVRKKKSDKTIGGSAEDFEFDDVNDSYWTDRIVQNYSEKQLLHNDANEEGNLQVAPLEEAKTVKSARGKPNSKRKFFYGSRPNTSEEEEKAKRLKQASSPAELILNFAERKCVPSEIKLNKTFRRFGPLMESETEVDHEAGRARVIFKRGSDAEVAHNSAQSFKIFGPVLVNYQIGHSPLISVKILPVALPQGHEDATLML